MYINISSLIQAFMQMPDYDMLYDVLVAPSPCWPWRKKHTYIYKEIHV